MKDLQYNYKSRTAGWSINVLSIAKNGRISALTQEQDIVTIVRSQIDWMFLSTQNS